MHIHNALLTCVQPEGRWTARSCVDNTQRIADSSLVKQTVNTRGTRILRLQPTDTSTTHYLLVFSQKARGQHVEDPHGSTLKAADKDLPAGMVGDGGGTLFGGAEVVQLLQSLGVPHPYGVVTWHCGQVLPQRVNGNAENSPRVRSHDRCVVSGGHIQNP